VPTPAWLAATANQPTRAGQINQMLGTHTSSLVYPGTQQANHLTGASGGTTTHSNGTWIGQQFATAAGQTTIGRITLSLAVTGTPTPLSVSLYANNAGPTGSALVTTLVPHELLATTQATVSIPLPATGLTASTTYWLVTAAVGDASNYYSWARSAQTSGTSTSTSGTTWTAQTYGMIFAVFDGTATGGALMHTWDDAGARWQTYSYDTTGRITALIEFTQGQTTTGYLYSSRTLTYTGGRLTAVA